MKKIISMLMAVLMVLSVGSVCVFAEDAPDYSKLTEYIVLRNESAGDEGSYVEKSFSVKNSYVVGEAEELGYNAIRNDGSITITNEADSDKYVMYVTLEPLYPNDNGVYTNKIVDDFPYYLHLNKDGKFVEGMPINPIDEEDIKKIFKGESITFEVPKNEIVWDVQNGTTEGEPFSEDIIWVICVSTHYGNYETIENSEYTYWKNAVEDDFGWSNWWYVKRDEAYFTNTSGNIEVKGPFNDVSSTDYYFNPILWAVEKNITKGTSETEFSPNEKCTYDQILTFLWRAKGSPVVEGEYSWVEENQYYTEAVKWAASNNLIDSDYYAGTSPCQRIDVVKFLYALTDITDYDKTSAEKMTDLTEEYKESVAWAIDNGVTMGTSETTFSPYDTCTRGQIVTFLYRAIGE